MTAARTGVALTMSKGRLTAHLPASLAQCPPCRAAASAAFPCPAPGRGTRDLWTCDDHDVAQMSLADEDSTVVLLVALPKRGKDPVANYLHSYIKNLALAFAEHTPHHGIAGRIAQRVRAAARTGMVSEDGLIFALAGWDRRAQEQANAGGVTARTAHEWSVSAGMQDHTPQQVIAWVKAGVHVSEAFQWSYSCGVRHPDDRPEGLRFDEAGMLRVAGVEPDPGWAYRPGFICPDAAALAAAAGHAPADIVSVVLSLAGPDPTAEVGPRCMHEDHRGREWNCYLPMAISQRVLETARGWIDLDWSVLANCLRAGLSEDEAEAYVRGGGDPQVMAVMAGMA